LLLAGFLPAAALLTALTGLLLLLLAGLLPAAALLTAVTRLLLLLAGLLPTALLATLVRIIHLAHRSVGMTPLTISTRGRQGSDQGFATAHIAPIQDEQNQQD
jgi:hypothetical protein